MTELPKAFTSEDGTYFVVDPYGHARFRSFHNESWGDLVTDAPGAQVRESPIVPPNEGPTSSQASSVSTVLGPTAQYVTERYDRRHDQRIRHRGDNEMAVMLMIIGWVIAGGGILAGFLMFLESQDRYAEDGLAILGMIVGAVGVVQGMTVVALGFVVRYLKAMAVMISESMGDDE